MDEHSTRQTALSNVLIDNDRVTITQWDFPNPGDATGWHRHGHDYVVVPMLDGKLKIVNADGTSEVPMKQGGAYFRPEGVEHDVINASDGAYAFIEIELKQKT